jgi:hypothetical protein
MQEQGFQENTYFIPPPMGNATKTYFQQLQASDSSIRNLTQYINIFNEQHHFDHNPISHLKETNVTPEFRDRLRLANLAIYKHLRDYLGVIISDQPANANIALEEVKHRIFEFNKLLGGLKVFETRM